MEIQNHQDGLAFWTKSYYYDTRFYFVLEKNETNENDISNLLLSQFYFQVKGKNQGAATFRTKGIHSREIETAFELMTSVFMVDFMPEAFKHFLNGLDSNDLHPFWVSFKILWPCFILAEFLATKYWMYQFYVDNDNYTFKWKKTQYF